MSAATAANPLVEIQRELAEFVHDPLGFVLVAYPWGEGELAGEAGPRTHQRRFLGEIRDHLQNPATRHKPFRKAISSGHGIGKSAEVSWLTHWALSTFEDTKVILMAGTGDQLKTKTQPEVAKWFRLGVNAELFEVNVQSIKVREPGHENTWRADFATWSEENPQASAGAHNKGKRLIIIYDEAAGIPDTIWKTQTGALTDAGTEILWIAISQCTRSEGYFYEATQATQRERWRGERIDSRDVEGTNVDEINETIALYGGEDADEARVRYRGLYPLAGEGKFIDLDLVNRAKARPAVSLSTDALIAGTDFAWGGSDNNVIRFRRGLDARTIPPIKVRGQLTKDPAIMVGKCVDALTRYWECADGVRRKVDMMFFDSAGIASAVFSGVEALGYKNRITLVNFGADSPKPHCAYWRDYMWDEMKQWMLKGGAIDSDQDLVADLQKPILVADRLQRVKLESKDDMKKRLTKMGLDAASPDNGDALALTFAHPVQIKKHNEEIPQPVPRNDSLGWMG